MHTDEYRVGHSDAVRRCGANAAAATRARWRARLAPRSVRGHAAIADGAFRTTMTRMILFRPAKLVARTLSMLMLTRAALTVCGG